jgi:hypothetical protein
MKFKTQEEYQASGSASAFAPGAVTSGAEPPPPIDRDSLAAVGTGVVAHAGLVMGGGGSIEDEDEEDEDECVSLAPHRSSSIPAADQQ